MDPITVSPTPPHPAEYLELFETTGWNERYRADEADLAHALENSWYVVTAREGERLVGMGRVVSDGAIYGMIYDMIVRPSHQGRGIGSRILEMLVERCRRAGLRDIQLFSSRGRAPWYRRRGFRDRPGDAPGMRLARPEDPVSPEESPLGGGPIR